MHTFDITALVACRSRFPPPQLIDVRCARLFAGDQAMLRAGLLMYDALHAWCCDGAGGRNGWAPAALRAAA